MNRMHLTRLSLGSATVAGGLATLTLAGPASVWFGVGLGATSMKDEPNAIIVSGDGTVTHSPSMEAL